MDYRHDLEKNPDVKVDSGDGYVLEDGAVRGAVFEIGDTWYAKAQRFAGKFHIEQRGIERVPEDERHDTGFKALLNVSTMWLSANMVVSSFAIGILGKSVFHLGFVDSFLTILFFNLLGITPVCWFSAFGPKFGLRQMVLSRLYFGFYGVKLIAFCNVLACIGWSSVNAIIGAQLLYAINGDLPSWAGILIIAFATFLVTLFGYKVVHAYAFWSWIPVFIIFMIILGEFAHSGAFVNEPMGSGSAEAASVLSFGGVVYGFATGWTTYAADYTVYQPATQSKRKVFFWTWLGLILPLCFTQMLAAAVITSTGNLDAPVKDYNMYAMGYYEAGNGGLISAILYPRLGDFGRFCVVVLGLSIIANNCPNIYSVGLSLQVLGRWTQAVPRFIWVFLATCVYIGIAIPAYDHFEEALENFMTFIGYWLALYEGVTITDHFVFKRGFKGYRPELYDMPNELPPGIAAVGAFLVGVVGAVLGMSQKWYIGEIGILVGGDYGGDLGFELAFGFSAIAYLVMRPVELKYFGR